MPIDPLDVVPLTDFLRHHKAHLAALAEHGRAQVLTVNGRSKVIVQDVAAWRRQARLAEEMRTLLAVRESLDAVKRGAGMSLAELDRTIRGKHGLARRRRPTGTGGH